VSSPPPHSVLDQSLIANELVQQQLDEQVIHERRVFLLNELDAADAERKQELKRQKRLQKKLHKKKKSTNIEQSTSVNNERVTNGSESISTETRSHVQRTTVDCPIDYDIHAADSVSKFNDELRKVSMSMTNEERTTKMNLILMKIKKQQGELKKLRQHVMSVLGEQPNTNLKVKNRSNTTITQDLLLALLNQPMPIGCWLCSGRMYSETATQCDTCTEQ
jgi:hypothetical protein